VTDYATAADLDTYFGNAEVLIAADRDGSGAEDTGVVAGALLAATEEIDTFLAVRYDLPLAAVPGHLMRVACDIAMYHLSINGPSMTKAKEEKYEGRLSWLKMLAKGLVTLGPEEAEVEVQDDVLLSTSSQTRLFTRTTMRGLT